MVHYMLQSTLVRRPMDPLGGGGDTAAKAILDADDTVRLESKLRNDVAWKNKANQSRKESFAYSQGRTWRGCLFWLWLLQWLE